MAAVRSGPVAARDGGPGWDCVVILTVIAATAALGNLWFYLRVWELHRAQERQIVRNQP
jgi:NhaP-type Na+/H+ or K+/H+ antiporter